MLVVSIDYFKFYRKDHIALKLLVASLVLLNAVGVACAIACKLFSQSEKLERITYSMAVTVMYGTLIRGFGDYARAGQEPIVFWANPFCTVATGLIAETYFAHRAWIVSPLSILPICTKTEKVFSFYQTT